MPIVLAVALFLVAAIVEVRLDLHLIRLQRKPSLRWFPPGCSSIAVAVSLANEFLGGPRETR